MGSVPPVDTDIHALMLHQLDLEPTTPPAVKWKSEALAAGRRALRFPWIENEMPVKQRALPCTFPERTLVQSAKQSRCLRTGQPAGTRRRLCGTPPHLHFRTTR